MKVTGFSPLIVTDAADAENTIELFERLGFERRHTHIRLDGRALDSTIIRMNVDNFEEAYELLTSRGFVCGSNSIIETPSSISALMISPTGFKFDLCQHIRKKAEN